MIAAAVLANGGWRGRGVNCGQGGRVANSGRGGRGVNGGRGGHGFNGGKGGQAIPSVKYIPSGNIKKGSLHQTSKSSLWIRKANDNNFILF